MAFGYSASFNVTDLKNNFSTIAIGSAGKTTATLQLTQIATQAPTQSTVTAGGSTTNVFNHAGGLGTTLAQNELSLLATPGKPLAQGHNSFNFGSPLTAALQAVAATAGWGGSQTALFVTWNPTTLRYLIIYSAALTVTFGNLQTARLLGFNTLTLSGASSYTSTQTPDFVLVPTLPKVSTPNTRDGMDYEGEGIAVQAMSDSGAVFGLSRSSSPQFRDWTQQFEGPEKAFNNRAGGLFNHQRLDWNCRTGMPFVLLDGFGYGTNEVFYLRNGIWLPDYASAGSDAQTHVRYECLSVGVLP